MSSANMTHETGSDPGRWRAQREKRRGPRTLPWGTPREQVFSSLRVDCCLISCERSLKVAYEPVKGCLLYANFRQDSDQFLMTYTVEGFTQVNIDESMPVLSFESRD